MITIDLDDDYLINNFWVIPGTFQDFLDFLDIMVA